MHPQLGPLVSAPLEDDPAKITTGMSLFAAAERVEEVEERKRMLYVAATRARDYLIFSSSLTSFDKPQRDWMKLLGERFDLEDGALIARLPGDYETPAVRVTTDPKTTYKPEGKSRGPDLVKMLEAAHRAAAEGDFTIPSEVASIPVDRAARRTFAFSHFSERLEPVAVTDGILRDDVRLDPRGFGSLVHDVLAHIEFGGDDRDLSQWCEHLASLHVVMNTDEAAKTAHELIARFVGSPAGRRLAGAAVLHREVEFLLAWPPGASGDEAFHLRGYIDCLYQDRQGAWRLADYKTDHASAADIPRFAQRYELQLSLYALAAERALGQSPVELALHFLRAGVEHVFPWNETTRRRAIDSINEAIARTNGSEFRVQGSATVHSDSILEL
jgi:ATP-dependent helicase/nuclease subunit A